MYNKCTTLNEIESIIKIHQMDTYFRLCISVLSVINKILLSRVSRNDHVRNISSSNFLPCLTRPQFCDPRFKTARHYSYHYHYILSTDMKQGKNFVILYLMTRRVASNFILLALRVSHANHEVSHGGLYFSDHMDLRRRHAVHG